MVRFHLGALLTTYLFDILIGRLYYLYMTKICATCKVSKETTEFHKCARQTGGLHYSCKTCRKIEAAKHSRNWRTKSRYNLTAQQFDAMVEKQNGLCAICERQTTKWHIDHNHACCPGTKTCGKCVRGLLCVSCNTALGHVEKVGVEAVRRYLTATA